MPRGENIKKTVRRELSREISDDLISEIEKAMLGYGCRGALLKKAKITDTTLYRVLKEKKATKTTENKIRKALTQLTQAA